jgi:hypothetical protein
MINRSLIVLIASAGLTAFGLGLISTPSIPDSAQRAPRPQAAPIAPTPAVNLPQIASYFVGLNPPPFVPPPPPPDVAILFRQDLAAVADAGQGLQLLIDDGGRRMRWLGVGSEFKDGWKVDRFDRQKVVLRRGKDTRSISLFTRVQQSPLGN